MVIRYVYQSCFIVYLLYVMMIY